MRATKILAEAPTDMTCSRTLTVAVLLALSLPATAETLAEAWAEALVSHSQIAAATAEREAATIDVERARTARLPRLGVSSAFTQLDTAPGFSFGNGAMTGPIFDNDNFFTANAQVSLPLYAGGGISSGIAAAESMERAADGQVDTVTQDIRLSVAEHYVAVLRAESAVDVATSTVTSLATHTNDTKNRYKLGAIPQNDYLASSVTLASAQQRLLQAKNALDYARSAYNRLLGRPLSTTVTLDPSLDVDALLPAVGIEALTEKAQAERQELRSLESQAMALHSQSDAARAGARPHLALTGGYTYLENAFLSDDRFWMAGVSFQWNLFDGGQSRKQAAALASRARSVGYRRADLESIVALQVRGAWNDRAEADSRLAVAEDAMVQARENLRVVRNRYEAGASTNAEVLDAEALLEQSLGNRDNARYELVLAKLRLARAVGTL